jgi:hypothetical protein
MFSLLAYMLSKVIFNCKLMCHSLLEIIKLLWGEEDKRENFQIKRKLQYSVFINSVDTVITPSLSPHRLIRSPIR